MSPTQYVIMVDGYGFWWLNIAMKALVSISASELCHRDDSSGSGEPNITRQGSYYWEVLSDVTSSLRPDHGCLYPIPHSVSAMTTLWIVIMGEVGLSGAATRPRSGGWIDVEVGALRVYSCSRVVA
jgi:hypothetical protein